MYAKESSQSCNTVPSRYRTAPNESATIITIMMFPLMDKEVIKIIHSNICLRHVQIQSGGQRVLPSPPENIGFLSNTGLAPLKNNKATTPAFNVRSSLTCQQMVFCCRQAFGGIWIP